MAKAASIKTEIRDKLGTKGAVKYRRNGLLPAIVYGHQQESLPVAIPANQFNHLLSQGAHLLELELPDKKETVLIKAIQYDYLGTNPVHVDLTRVDLTERVSVTVPLNLRGTAAGVSEGGSLRQALMELLVECVVTDIPNEIRVKISELKIGDSLQAKDIELPEGVTLLTDEHAVIVSVALEVEEEAAEEEVPGAAPSESAEPEVIGKGKEKEEGSTGES